MDLTLLVCPVKVWMQSLVRELHSLMVVSPLPLQKRSPPRLHMDVTALVCPVKVWTQSLVREFHSLIVSSQLPLQKRSPPRLHMDLTVSDSTGVSGEGVDAVFGPGAP
ncbi:unnamed protein product [Effrenium voratum]|uniref:Uncharacterized protein n=1 Tax=Effrenium voratum TaxID=2562239 RepID=A0AA36HLT0_9DINO|nr:unnamed protein product [Effrenium voratum]